LSHRLSSPYHRLDRRPLSHSVPSLVGAIALARLMPRRLCPHTYGIRRNIRRVVVVRRRRAFVIPYEGFCESRADRVSESTKFFRKAKKGDRRAASCTRRIDSARISYTKRENLEPPIYRLHYQHECVCG